MKRKRSMFLTLMVSAIKYSINRVVDSIEILFM